MRSLKENFKKSYPKGQMRSLKENFKKSNPKRHLSSISSHKTLRRKLYQSALNFRLLETTLSNKKFRRKKEMLNGPKCKRSLTKKL